MHKFFKGMVAAATTLALISAPTLAASASTIAWSTPQQLLEDQTIDSNIFSLNDGTTVATWNATINSHSVVQMISKPLGSNTWSSVSGVTPADLNGSQPVFTSDAKGNMVVVWLETTSPNTLRASQKLVGHGWSAPVIIGQGDSYSVSDIRVTTDKLGNTTAMWVATSGGSTSLETAELPAGGQWRAAQAIDANGRAFQHLQVALAPNGSITLAYQRTDGSDYRVESVTRKFGQAWTAPVVLSAAGSSAYEPQITSDPFSNVTVVWHRTVDWWARLQVATRSAAGVWGSVSDISPDNQYMVEHVITSDGKGNLTLMWSGVSDGTQYHEVTSTKPAGGSWSTPVDFSPPNVDASTMQLSTCANGSLLAVWLSNSGGTTSINFATKASGQDWAQTQTLYSTTQNLRGFKVAALPNGAATAIWVQRPQWNHRPPMPNDTLWSTTLTRSYEVSYSVNGAGGSTPSASTYSTDTPNTTITAPAGLSRAGFNFVGWNSKADGTGAQVKAGEAFTPIDDTTLYAQWQAQLADTGANLMWQAFFALALLATGGYLLIVRKTKP